jgi:WD40 repeat protein/uncharacterized caspase-like protein
VKKIRTPSRWHGDRFVPVLYAAAFLLGTLALLFSAVRCIAQSGELKPELVTQIGHNAKIQGLVFSRDGKLLASTGEDNSLRIWNVGAGRVIAAFNIPGLREGALVISTSGDQVAVRAGTQLLVLDWVRNQIVAREEVGPGRIMSLSPDGTLLLAGTSDGFVQIRDFATLKLLRAIKVTEGISALAITRDNSTLAVGSYASQSANGRLTLWSLAPEAQPREVRTGGATISSILLDQQADRIIASGAGAIVVATLSTPDAPAIRKVDLSMASNLVVIAPSGRTLVTSSLARVSTDHTIRHSDVDGGLLRVFEGHQEPPTALTFAPGEEVLASGSYDTSIKLWDLKKGVLIRSLEKDPAPPHLKALAVTSDSRLLAIGDTDRYASIWNLLTGKPIRRLQQQPNWIHSVAFSGNGALLATGDYQNSVRLWDVESGTMVSRLPSLSTDAATDAAKVAYSPAGEAIVYLSLDGVARVWSLRERRIVAESMVIDNPRSLAVSPTEAMVAVGHGKGVLLWNWTKGQIRSFHSRSAEHLVFSPDGSRLAFSEMIWSDEGGRLLAVAERYSKLNVVKVDGTGPTYTAKLATSPEALLFVDEGKSLVVGDDTGALTLWGIDPFLQMARWNAHPQGVTGLAAISGGRLITTASEDGSFRFWSVQDQNLLLTVQTLTEGNWLISNPEGRFDTSSVDQTISVGWRMPDDPRTILSPEIFMRDYFEPRLLPRLLACREAERTQPDACRREFKEVRPLASLNRAQPEISSISVTPEPDGSGEVAVTVQVRGIERSFGTADQERTWQSGAYDLRLFRDGQLVGQAPDRREPEPLEALDPEADVARWRETHRLLVGVGDKQVTFRHIRLPHREQGGDIEFSAYAFNADRVKSGTARMTHTLVPARPVRRAYVVAVGVSAYEDRVWDLRYADDDARRLVEVLGPRLKATGRYAEVVSVPLLADWAEPDGVRTVTAAAATKANVRAVLDILAGRDVPGEVRRALPNGTRLQRAGPDDLVLIAYSSHGYADRAGNFYLFPYDIGSGTGRAVTPEILKRAISSAELSVWLRDLDAGELIMVVDACHSAASVESPEFKPGPMGARGLGQLAYDKGMRILASTRANDVAWESARTQQGLLSYALVQDGLADGRADFRPRDGSIGVQEWLEYAAGRVPQLYAEALGTRGAPGPGKSAAKGSASQRPAQTGPGPNRSSRTAAATGTPARAARLVEFDSASRSARYITRPGAASHTQQPALFNYKRGEDTKLVTKWTEKRIGE